MMKQYYNLFGSLCNNVRFEILAHNFFKGDTSWNFKDVCSPFSRLYIITNGSGRIYNSFHKVELTAGDVCIVPSNATYNYECDNYIEKYYVHFRFEIFGGQDITGLGQTCSCISISPQCVDEIIRRISIDTIIDSLFCRSACMNIVVSYLAPYSDELDMTIQKGLKYQGLYQYIDSNCNAGICMQDLANLMNVSKSHLSRCFSKDTGITLKAYLNRQIIQKAKENLLLTDISIKEIAYMLKFQDEFYFSRFFKKCVGCSPSEYRKASKFL